MKRFVYAVSLGLWLASTAHSTAHASSAEKLELLSEECRDFVSKLPAGYFWDVIEAPENRQGFEQKENIRVFYYGLLVPGKTPILFFNGGPAASSHKSFLNFERAQAGVAPPERLPFVYVDQRGTGCSTAYPDPTNAENIDRILHFSSREIVADAELIRRRLLKNQPWIIYGSSYGGNIVARYLMLYPDSVRAAFLQAPGLTIGVDLFKERLKIQQAAWASFAEKRPSSAEKFSKLLNLIPSNHCLSLQASPICGRSLMDFSFHWIGLERGEDALEQWLDVFFTEDGSLDLSQVDELAASQFATDQGLSSWFVPILSWKDLQNGLSDAALAAKTRESLLASGIDDREWPTSELRFLLTVQNPQIEKALGSLPLSLADPIDLPLIAKNLKNKNQTKVTFFAGDLDVYIPAVSVETTAHYLKQSGVNTEFFLVKGTGHFDLTAHEIVLRALNEASSGVAP